MWLHEALSSPEPIYLELALGFLNTVPKSNRDHLGQEARHAGFPRGEHRGSRHRFL